MKRRIKKELVERVTIWFSGVGMAISIAEDNSIGVLNGLAEKGLLVDAAFEPQPFECWVCPECLVTDTDKNNIFHLKTICKGTPIKMIQEEGE